MKTIFGLRVGNDGNLVLDIDKTNNFVGTGKEVWCNLSLELITNNIKLSISGEIITDYEISTIIDYFNKILNGTLNEKVTYETLDSYLDFSFEKDHAIIYINFDNSNDYYSLYLNKYNINELNEYLKTIK